ncbi:unnamed protein product [Acidithrix sp. C25]|nr:unnamed protein product [Acidithrix sp. C25]
MVRDWTLTTSLVLCLERERNRRVRTCGELANGTGSLQ